MTVVTPGLNAKGGNLNDPIALKLGENHLWLSLANSEILLWAQGDISEPDVSRLQLQGPKSGRIMQAPFDDDMLDLRYFRFCETSPRAHAGARKVLQRTFGAIQQRPRTARGCRPRPGGGNPRHTNPEQALAAALSSCHMMMFLALCAKAGWPVASNHDHAEAHLGKNAKGQMSATRIDLDPVVRFDTGFAVAAEKLAQMHDRAHRYCFIANTLADCVEINVN